MKTLLSVLIPMVGVRSSDIQPALALPDELTISTTGLTLDQCHDLLSLPTLKAAKRNNDITFEGFLVQTRADACRSLITTLSTKLAEAALSPLMLTTQTLYPPIVLPAATNHADATNGVRIRVIQNDTAVRLERIWLDTPLTGPVVLTLTDELTGETEGITLTTVGNWQTLTEPVSLRAGRTYTLTYATGTSSYNTRPAPKVNQPCRGCKNCLSSLVEVSSTSGESNYGINLVLSARGDVTGRLIDDPDRLLSALQHQIAFTFLEKIAYSDRKNGPTADAVEAALFALTAKENLDRVPVRLDKALTAVVGGLVKETATALDIDDSDDVTWGSL